MRIIRCLEDMTRGPRGEMKQQKYYSMPFWYAWLPGFYGQQPPDSGQNPRTRVVIINPVDCSIDHEPLSRPCTIPPSTSPLTSNSSSATFNSLLLCTFTIITRTHTAIVTIHTTVPITIPTVHATMHGITHNAC